MYRGIKFSFILMMLSSMILAFICVRNVDESSIRGSSYSVSFDKSEGGTEAADVARAIETFAGNQGTNVGRLYYDPFDSSVRRIYLAVGDPNAESTRWLAEGYPYFSREAKLEFRPYIEAADVEPNGTYFVFGPRTKAHELVHEFKALGYEAKIEQNPSIRERLPQLIQGSLRSFFLVICLIIIVTIASAVAFNAKAYGIQRLHGKHFLAIVRNDIGQLAGFWLATIAATIAITAIALWVYNRLHQIESFAIVALTLAGTYLVAAVLSYLLVLALLFRGAILASVQGEVSADWAIAGSYVLRGWSLLLLLSISTSVIASGLEFKKQRDIHEAWRTLGDASYLRIDGAVEYLENGRDISERIGKSIHTAAVRGDVAIASPQRMPETALTTLVVNERYLAKHAIYNAHGSRVPPATDNALRTLVPNSLDVHSGEISAAIARWTESHGIDSTTDIKIEKIRDSQTAFRYTRSPTAKSVEISDPVIVVLPRTRLLPYGEYVYMASRGEVLFEDPEGAMQEFNKEGLSSHILGMSPFIQDVADRYRDTRRDFFIDTLNLVAGIFILLATAFMVSQIYCQRNTQRLFAQYVHGWSFIQSYRRPLLIEVALGASIVIWVWRDTASVLSRLDTPEGMPVLPDELILGGWEPAAAAGLAVINIAATIAILNRVRRRFAKNHSLSLA